MVQFWSRNVRTSEQTKPSNTTVWMSGPLRLKALTGYCWCPRATMKGVGIEQQKNRTGLVLAGERAAYRLNSTAASSVGLTIDFESVETIFQPLLSNRKFESQTLPMKTF